VTKLKLNPLVDDKPVKLTVELPARVHRDLLAYAPRTLLPRPVSKSSRQN
jgi:hypothetical protein